MKNASADRSGHTNKRHKKLPGGISWLELALFLLIFVIMNLMYGMPVYMSGRANLHYVREVAIDCLILSVSCIPVWWLHFRRWRHWPLKKRFLFHPLTATLFYTCWTILYTVYNPLSGKPVMTAQQVLMNLGPNVLFYIQVFSILHIYHFFRERASQLEKEKELTALAYKSEINALKAQIQPHFLFNTLNSISASVTPEQEKTRVLIARLADIFRYALNATQEDLVPLPDELQFISTYLSLEKERFKSRLQVNINAGDDVADVYIPPMLLQPLVENAINHGIAPKVEGGTITVECKRENNHVLISVCDTGAGYAGELGELTQRGIGLKNISQRIEKTYNEKLMISRTGKGLCFSFKIPSSHTNSGTMYIHD